MDASTPRVASGPIFTDDERSLLVSVLDQLVPAARSLPGAGTLGIDCFVEAAVEGAPALRRGVFSCLRAIEIAAAAAGRTFGELPEDSKQAVLAGVENGHPKAFGALVEQTYRGYYTDQRVQRALGFPDSGVQPAGFELPMFDEGLLASQRGRAPFWRRAT